MLLPVLIMLCGFVLLAEVYIAFVGSFVTLD